MEDKRNDFDDSLIEFDFLISVKKGMILKKMLKKYMNIKISDDYEIKRKQLEKLIDKVGYDNLLSEMNRELNVIKANYKSKNVVNR